MAGSTNGSSTRRPFKANTNGFTETLESVVGRPIFDPYPHFDYFQIVQLATSNVNYRLAATQQLWGISCSSPKPSSARTTGQTSNFFSNNPTPCFQFFNPANPKARSNSSSATPQHGLTPQSTVSLRIPRFQQLLQQNSLHAICKHVVKLADLEHSGVCTHLNPWAS